MLRLEIVLIIIIKCMVGTYIIPCPGPRCPAQLGASHFSYLAVIWMHGAKRSAINRDDVDDGNAPLRVAHMS